MDFIYLMLLVLCTFVVFSADSIHGVAGAKKEKSHSSSKAVAGNGGHHSTSVKEPTITKSARHKGSVKSETKSESNKGVDTKELQVVDTDEDGRKNTHDYDDGSYRSDHDKGDEKSAGAKYGSSNRNKAGRLEKGFRNKYSKNEFHSLGSFFGGHHEGGDYTKYGKKSKHHHGNVKKHSKKDKSDKGQKVKHDKANGTTSTKKNRKSAPKKHSKTFDKGETYEKKN